MLPRLCSSTASLLATGSVLVATAFCSATARGAERFPPIAEAERDATAPLDATDAPAVVLWREGEFVVHDLGRRIGGTRYTMRMRAKLLTDEGVDLFGETLASNRPSYEIHGQALLPDGAEIPLIELERPPRGRYMDEPVPTARFDGLVPGAIVDVEVTYRTLGELFLDDWIFESTVPSLRSEVVYRISGDLGANLWYQEATPGTISIETERGVDGLQVVRATATNLKGIPEEPLGPPPFDRSNRMTLILTQAMAGRRKIEFQSDWARVCAMVGYGGGLSKKAKRLLQEQADGSGPDPRATADALYRFVRDRVQVVGGFGVWRAGTVDDLLSGEPGSAATRALALVWALRDSGIEAGPVWARSRHRGRVDLRTPNVAWFDSVLIRAVLDGQEVFLDPSDPRLPFGDVAPRFEGMDALLYDTVDPQIRTLPRSAPEENRRDVRLDLAIDDAGGVAGTGRIELAGHRRLRSFGETPEAETAYWADWLGGALEDFAVDDVRFERGSPAGTAALSWSMARDADGAGVDRVEIRAGSAAEVQPALGPASERESPIVLPYRRIDTVEIRVAWPASFRPVLPGPSADRRSPVAALIASTSTDGSSPRTLVTSRAFEIRKAEVEEPGEIRRMLQTFTALAEHDRSLLAFERVTEPDATAAPTGEAPEATAVDGTPEDAHQSL